MVQDIYMSSTIQQIGQCMNVIDNNNNNDNNSKTQVLIVKITRMTTKSFISKFDEPYDRTKKFNRAQDLTQLAPGKKIATHKNTHKSSLRTRNYFYRINGNTS